MTIRSRREFLANVGQGMLIASVGSACALDLGLTSARAAEGEQSLEFGELEPLVDLMQQTPPDKLLPLLVDRIQRGTALKTLISAGALANARAFGGQDYVGYHSFMALGPAYQMSQELPARQQPLPVLKVLYRNSDRMQQVGGIDHNTLHPIDALPLETGREPGEQLREDVRSRHWEEAEGKFAALVHGQPGEAFQHLQYTVQDEMNVHRVVLAWRAWETLDLTGMDHAHTLLRQSIRFCLDSEQSNYDRRREQFLERINSPNHVRQVLPRLIDQYRLLSKDLGKRRVDDAWIDAMSRTIAESPEEVAADAVAAALADGISPVDIAEAISLAANLLLLRDEPGRTHGDSKGVHASDAAAAWRQIALVSNHRNTVASLIAGAYHTGGQQRELMDRAWPRPEHLEAIKATDAATLLTEAEDAIRSNDQQRACAAIHRYGELGLPARAAFDLLLKYSISEDGRLHAEKYYRTASEEFAVMRPAFRWRQLVALARVSASAYGYNRDDEHGFRAPGYEEACKLLKLT